MPAPTIVEVEGRKLKLTNLDKILYPATGFTKGQVVDYYARIAPVLVPHLAGRPLTMKRYPGGVGDDREFFFEKNAPKHRPDWVKTAPVWSEGNNRTMYYILANDLPRWFGLRTSRRSNFIPRSRWRPTLQPPPRLFSILIPGRRRTLCSAVRSGSGCVRF